MIKYFVDLLGEPRSIDSLELYIKFCMDNNGVDIEEYSEYHHILPRSKFPEFIKSDWNLVQLSYKNHVDAHFLLIEAYPINQFTRPLNFLKEYTPDQKIALTDARSISSKQQWVDLKNDPEKYADWVRRRKEWHIENNFPGSEFYENTKRRFIEMHKNNPNLALQAGINKTKWWAELSTEEYEKICQDRRDAWDEARHQLQIEQLAARYSDPVYMAKFTEKMTEVNKNEEKRRLAGEKIKLLWESEEYRTKVMESRRKSRELKLMEKNNEAI